MINMYNTTEVPRVHFTRSSFGLFLLAIVLSVLLQFTASDYPFGILKLFTNLNDKP